MFIRLKYLKMIRSLLKEYYFKIFEPSLEVYLTPRGARWGNLLYFFLRASIYKERGRNFKILYTQHMNELLDLFPLLRQFVIYEKEVKFFHLKNNSHQYYQIFGEDYKEKELNFFIKKYLIESIQFKNIYNKIPNTNNSITLNIRRGDFYEKGNMSVYGYNQIDFVKHVFDKYLQDSEFEKINIISDDMMWCEKNMSFLTKYSKSLHFPVFNENIILESFCWLVKSNKLILSNSTFSFWGAYLSNYLNNSVNETYCPIFGSRRIENTDLYQYNSKWVMIRDFDFNK